MKTRPTGADVGDFLARVVPPLRRSDALQLDGLFRAATGFSPQIWGDSIVGYGRYDYTYASGRSGSFLATGFAPRKSALSLYILPGYTDFSPILARLGKHNTGKSCLYVNKLADVDMTVLAELVRAGLKDLSKHWDVYPS